MHSMSTAPPQIIIVGGSLAGLTLWHWLVQQGACPFELLSDLPSVCMVETA